MALIDQMVFIDEILIPKNTSDISQEQEIIRFINKYEPEFLKRSMGLEFYQLFAANLTTQRFIDLRDGVIWIDKDGHSHEWFNIRYADANYVYYWFQRNRISQTAMIGEIRTADDPGTRVSPEDKLIKAFNAMCHQVCNMWEMLRCRVNEDETPTYPEWMQYPNPMHCRVNFRYFTPINTMGI